MPLSHCVYHISQNYFTATCCCYDEAQLGDAQAHTRLRIALRAYITVALCGVLQCAEGKENLQMPLWLQVSCGRLSHDLQQIKSESEAH